MSWQWTLNDRVYASTQIRVDEWQVKGMHWSTYERLLGQHENFVGVSLAGMARKLGLSRGLLENIEDAACSSR